MPEARNPFRRTFLRQAFADLKLAASNWSDNKAITSSAAISFYSIFSLAPLLLIAAAVAGFFLGEASTRDQIHSLLAEYLGPESTSSVERILDASSVKRSGIIATVVGVITLLVGATTVFSQLSEALNVTWGVHPRSGQGLRNLIRQRLLGFSVVGVIALLLLLSLALTAAISIVGNFAATRLPGGEVLWQGLNSAVSFGVITLLFAAIYKILPRVKLAWRNVWSGAVVTALLFTLGKYGISLYLAKSGVSSTYGAAGAVILILLWTYYSSAIFLYGAEVSHVHSLRAQPRIDLKTGAEWDAPLDLRANEPRSASTSSPGA